MRVMLLALLAGGALLIARDQEHARAPENQHRVELLHARDLKALYLEINHESFDDQLPGDVPVTWANIVNTRDCSGCGGMTSYDEFKPKIQIDLQTVTTEEILLPLMRHEMCHVEVYSVEGYKVRERDWEQHGAPWQACMARFQ
jgi:hypothetical protein